MGTMSSDLSLGDLLPAAIGIALSPVPIAAVILMLFSDRARRNGPAFVAGWVAGLAVVGGALLAFGADSAGSRADPSTTALVVKSVLGLLLLVVAAKQWRGRPRGDEEPSMPKWMASIDAFTAVKAFGVAVVLSGVNPKNLALNAAGVLTIAEGGLDPAGQWLAFGVFVLLASLTVALPVAYYFLAGDRASATLDSLKNWLVHNNATVMAVLLLIFGVKLLADGAQGLLG
jgi:hypothetical protein